MNADFKQPVTIDSTHSFQAYFTWGQPTVGFGEFAINIVDGEVRSLDSECMGKEWSRRALYALVDAVVEEAFNLDGSPKR